MQSIAAAPAFPPRPSWQRAWRGLAAAGLALALAACGGGSGDLSPEDRAQLCREQVNDTPEKLLSCVNAAGVQVHLQALARIAQDNGGSRAVGTPGFTASVAYVERQLRQAGYQVQVQTFEHRVFEPTAAPVLEIRGAVTEALPNDFMNYSGVGAVTATAAVPSGSPLACAASDFAGFPRGSIAVVERGVCAFVDKARAAAAAGAAGLVVYNNEPGDVAGNLGEDFELPLVVLGVPQSVGQRLVAAVPGGLVLHMEVQALTGRYTSQNVVAESVGGDPDQVIVAGAHLDSVPGTAGINDNGSGTGALLETALQLARTTPRNKLRFGFWGSEELGLVGSTHYVDGLSDSEVARIALYLNFDMVASPNHGYQVYASDGRTPEGHAPRASVADLLRSVFTSFYASRGLAWEEAQGVDGRSDQEPFAARGVPYAGLFTGAEALKTEREASLWGGVAGQPFDACYHQACDNLSNINLPVLEVNVDAIARAVLHFATFGLRG